MCQKDTLSRSYRQARGTPWRSPTTVEANTTALMGFLIRTLFGTASCMYSSAAIPARKERQPLSDETGSLPLVQECQGITHRELPDWLQLSSRQDITKS